MSRQPLPPLRVAVIGAGIAGSSCAASLRQAGLAVTVFDKSRGVGGRMATRRVDGVVIDGQPQALDFDHGAQHIPARHPRFKGALRRAAAAGVVAAWSPRVHAAWPAPTRRETWVPLAGMPALARHMLGDAPLQLQCEVQRLQRSAAGWELQAADGSIHGPFDQVLLAMPPAQAAALLAGQHDRWAEHLAGVPMQACWTLMAATQEVDWPWDACEPEAARSPLAWVARNDRKPGRQAPAGVATWVAHATPEWTAQHLEDSPAAVQAALSQALGALLPRGVKLQWHHRAVHRWRYALPAEAAPAAGSECWWDAQRGLGVCGDFLGRGGQGGVEAAWRSGDELADTLLAALDDETEPARPVQAANDARRSPAPAGGQPLVMKRGVALAHAA